MNKINPLIKHCRHVRMTRKKIRTVKKQNQLPKPDALEIVAATWHRNERDENSGLHLSDPLLRLVLLHEHDRVDPAPARRRRRRLAARYALQPRLQLLSPLPRRARVRARRAAVRPPEPLRRVRLGVALAVLVLNRWRRSTRITGPICS